MMTGRLIAATLVLLVSCGPSRDQNAAGTQAQRARPRPAKLTFKEQRELDGLPAALEALEQEQISLGERMAALDYHKRGADAIRADRARAIEIEKLLAEKLERWVELESRAPVKDGV